MRLHFWKISLLIFFVNLSCKSQVTDFKKDEVLQQNLLTILSTFVQHELDIKSQFNPIKDKLILFIGVNYRENLYRNSKIHFDIEFWSKEYADIYDAKYQFNGIDVIFDKTNYNYIDVFNLKKKTDKEIERTKKIVKEPIEVDSTSKVQLVVVKGLTHAFSQINVYLNLDNEITYIDLQKETYYELLNEKIKFNEKYWDEIKIKN